MCATPRFPRKPPTSVISRFGPLEPVYDYDKARATFTRENIAVRARNLWRYRELLPITGEPLTGFGSGFTPLVPAPRLAARLGLRELYVKDDGVNYPTLSYKDRVVSVGGDARRRTGSTTFACASTGNLGNSVAAHASRLGLRCFVFIPDDLEPYKVLGSAIYRPTLLAVRGNYDDVNRLCSQVADKHGWGFPTSTCAAARRGLPRRWASRSSSSSGGASQNTSSRRGRWHAAAAHLQGLPRTAPARASPEGDLPKMYGAQAAGSAPVVRALHEGLDYYANPVKPDTIAKSIAIGNPADGFQVIEVLKESGGWGEMVTNKEILDGITLLAETEGIYTEPAGGTTVAVARKLIEQDRIPRHESIVLCITGNGYKTADIMTTRVAKAIPISRSLDDLDAYLAGTLAATGERPQ